MLSVAPPVLMCGSRLAMSVDRATRIVPPAFGWPAGLATADAAADGLPAAAGLGSLHLGVAVHLEAAFGAQAAQLHAHRVERRFGQRPQLLAHVRFARLIAGEVIRAAPEIRVEPARRMPVVALDCLAQALDR